MDRRHFLLNSFRKQPLGVTDINQIMSGLSPYSGVWDTPQVVQLLRRTTFGVRKADINQLLGMSVSAAVDLLLTPQALPSPPVNNYITDPLIPDPDVPVGQTWVNAPYTSVYNGPRRSSFKAWWVGLMVNQGLNITEKMTLFWHNHLATEINGMFRSRFCYNNNTVLRQNALGNFKTMVRQITTDCGMLRYLNGEQNTRNAPDENYARELQELFTIGKDLTSSYIEADVQAAARVLTGFRNDYTTETSYFDSTRHDSNSKQFSEFYGNTIIYGQTGTDGALELDQMIDMIFAQEEVAKFICRKLYRFFVYYQITPEAEANIILPLADIFRNNNYDILPVLSALFKSEHFYDMTLFSCYIKSPIDFAVGICRELNVAVPVPTVSTEYKAYARINTNTTAMQMNIGDPPNVSGWPAYYQSPLYHETWLNTDSYAKRMEFINTLSENGHFVDSGGYRLKANYVTYITTYNNPEDPNLLIDEAISLLYTFEVTQIFKDYLKSFLLSGQTSDYYWTNAWYDYTGNPSTANFNTVNTRLKGMFKYLLSQAEYQIC